MALLFMEGFDHFGSDGADLNDFCGYSKWDSCFLSSIDCALPAGRYTDITPSRCIQIDGRSANYYLTKYLAANESTIIVGFNFKHQWAGTASSLYPLRLKDGTTSQVNIDMDLGQMWVRNGDGTILLGPYTYSENTWYHLEIKVTFHATTGSVELRLDGTTKGTASNVDTINTANEYIDRVTIGGAVAKNGGDDMFFDDFYLLNTAGSYNNDFLGPCRIMTRMPDADAAPNDWSSTGASEYTEIDENDPDDDTTYIYSSTVSQESRFTHSNVVGEDFDAIKAVQHGYIGRFDEGSARGVTPTSNYSGTQSDGSEDTMVSSYEYYGRQMDTAPDGSAWDGTKVDATEFGVKVTT